MSSDRIIACDRCGRTEGKMSAMGHEINVYVCFSCHKLWHDKFIKELDDKRLGPLSRQVEWQKLFDKFMGVKKTFVFR